MRRASPALARLTDDLKEGVVAFRGRRVLAINHGAAELLGMVAERATGRSLIEVVVSHRLERLALHGGEEEFDYRGRTLRARGVPGGLILEDVSEQRRRERELREVGAVLSHEFRTPVTAISSLLEAIALDPPEEERRRFALLAAEEARRLSRLVEDMTTELRAAAERRVALGEPLARVRQVLSSTYAGQAAALITCGENELVRCDPDKLVQVLINLVENAFKYAPADPPVRVAGARGGDLVTVTVTDAGPPLEDYQGIFEGRRDGSRRTGPGSGLGLRVVRGIVTGWGGRTWARRSPADDGNEFAFTVPAA